MNTKDCTNNLAVIGTSGAGKTTLAVGLYATSTPEFTVADNLSDETRNYLEIRKTSIQEHFWPAATNESENLDLYLALHAAGKETDIVFRDYMGERMEKDPNYIREVIGKPKSAMILFNPGMPGETVKKAVSFLEEAAQQFDGQSPLENWGGQNEIARWSQKLGIPRFYNSHDTEKRNRLLAELSEVGEMVREFEGAKARDEGLRSRIASKFRTIAGEVGNLHVLGLTEPETRNRMIGNLQRIAQHLKDNGCIAVAFVVTASDRLSSDLKDFREDFEAYASEVTNHLTNLRLNWKRFDVTVSGQLEDQNKPKLARGENNTTHEPFLWLLACIKHHEFWRRVKVSAATAAVLLAVAGAAFGGLVCQSRAALDKAEKEIEERLAALDKAYAVSDESDVRTNAAFLTNDFGRIRTYLPSDRKRKDDLSKRKDEQSDLWGVRLLAMEFADTTNSLASTPLKVPLNWFDAFDKKLISSSPSSADAVDERDGLTNAWASTRQSFETHCQTAHFRDDVEKESKNLAAKEPEKLVDLLKNALDIMEDKNHTYSLVTNRNDLCAGLKVERTNAIARYVDSKTTWKPTDPEPPTDTQTLIQQIRGDLKSALNEAEFQEVSRIVEERRSSARTAWEQYQFPERRKAQLDELKASSDSPSDALKSSFGFLRSMDDLFPSIPETARTAARTAVTNERAAAINRYLDRLANFKPEDDERPAPSEELQNTARKDLKSALTDSESENLSDLLAARCSEARRAWDAYHFPRRVSELETALKDAGAKPAKPLKESLAFLGSMTNDYPTISQADFIRTRASLVQVRNAALSAYGNFIADNWDVNGRKPPEFDGKKIRDTILTDAVVTDAEASAFDRDMEKRFAKANEDWKAVQKDRCDSFVRQKLSLMPDVSDALSAYMDFRQENSKNPFVENVDSIMTKRLEDRIEWLVKEYHKEFRSENAVWDVDANRSMRMQKAQNEFNELKRLCFAITNPMLEGTPVQHSWASKFALLCIEKGGLKESGINSAFQQRFEMTKIQVKVDFKSTCVTFIGLSMGAEIRSRYWQDGAKNSMAETLVDVGARNWTVTEAHSGKWYELWNGSRSFIINPWTDSYFSIYWEDRVDPGINVPGHFSENIWSEFRNNKEYRDGYLEYVDSFHGEHVGQDTKGTITVRIYGRFTGVDLSMLLRQSQQ